MAARVDSHQLLCWPPAQLQNIARRLFLAISSASCPGPSTGGFTKNQTRSCHNLLPDSYLAKATSCCPNIPRTRTLAELRSAGLAFVQIPEAQESFRTAAVAVSCNKPKRCPAVQQLAHLLFLEGIDFLLKRGCVRSPYLGWSALSALLFWLHNCNACLVFPPMGCTVVSVIKSRFRNTK